MSNNILAIIKIVMAILFFLCLAHMPYSYYEFVRFSAMVGFALLAYGAFQNKKNDVAIMYICLAFLFQPFIKVALGRQLWNIVDVVLAIALIISVFINKSHNRDIKKS